MNGAAARTRTALGWLGVLGSTWLGTDIAWAQDRSSDWGWGMHPMTGFWGVWGSFMMLGMLLFWGLIIAGMVIGIRWLVRSGGDSRSDTAMDILRQRYARGEIDKEEFEARRRDLR